MIGIDTNVLVRYIAQDDGRYFSRTRNGTIAAARDRSPLWRRVRHTESRERDGNRGLVHIELAGHRSTGHEYIGSGQRRASCRQCGRLFPTARSHARYCDGACRVAAHRLRSSVNQGAASWPAHPLPGTDPVDTESTAAPSLGTWATGPPRTRPSTQDQRC